MKTFSHMEDARKKMRSIIRASKAADREVIARYTAAILPNFVTWMTAAYLKTQNASTRQSLKENLRCEINDQHQAMLDAFARGAHAWPRATDFVQVGPEVATIRRLVAAVPMHRGKVVPGVGVAAVGVCAALENFSLDFIPDLARRAKRRGSKEFVYTNAHGEADLKHARILSAALQAELNYADPNGMIHVGTRRMMFESVLDLMSKVYA